MSADLRADLTIASLDPAPGAHGGSALAVPALAVDDLRRIAAAIADASGHLDAGAVAHFSTVLTQCTTDDGALGPRRVVASVLGVLAAVEGSARDAQPAARSELLKVGAEAAEFAGSSTGTWACQMSRTTGGIVRSSSRVNVVTGR